MKKYIYIVAILMAFVVESVAQEREFPALQINFKDGTSELVTFPISGYRYGVDNPKDGDYITCSLERAVNVPYAKAGSMIPKYSLTEYGVEAESLCQKVGLIFSDAPIDTTALDVSRIGGDIYAIINQKSDYIYEKDFLNTVSQELGKVYYCLAYYMLDGTVYYSEQLEQKIPKTLVDVLKRKGVKSLPIDDKNVVIMDSKEVRSQLYAHYGVTSSLCIDSLAIAKESEFHKTLTVELAKQSALAVDTCDDGHIYYVSLPASYTQEIINHIDQEANTSFYVKATIETAIYPLSAPNKREFATVLASGVELAMVDCDAKWGVKDNQYLHSNIPATSNFSPAIALNLNHIMVPGKKYNITFSLAPQTDAESVDTLNLQFYVLMADGQGVSNVNDTYPEHVTSPKSSSDKYFIKSGGEDPYVFVGYADKVTSYTFEYTPERLEFSHAFKVVNQFPTMLSSRKKLYGHNIRLIGVEVTPAE